MRSSPQAPQAHEALRGIRVLYALDKTICGKTPVERCRVRHEQALPQLADFNLWMDTTLAATSFKSGLARAVLYSHRQLGGRSCDLAMPL